MAFTPYAAANIERKNVTAKEIGQKMQISPQMRHKNRRKARRPSPIPYYYIVSLQSADFLLGQTSIFCD